MFVLGADQLQRASFDTLRVKRLAVVNDGAREVARLGSIDERGMPLIDNKGKQP